MVTLTVIQGPNPELINHDHKTVFHGFGPSIFWNRFKIACPF